MGQGSSVTSGCSPWLSLAPQITPSVPSWAKKEVLLHVRSAAAPEGLRNLCLFAFAACCCACAAAGSDGRSQRGPAGKGRSRKGVGREQGCRSRSERPQALKAGLCVPLPPGPAWGKTLHNPAIVCLEKSTASYCNYL